MAERQDCINSSKVSILIPVYNREKIILETLNLAISQTYSNIEIIVVDNKSTDSTFKIVKEFAKSYQNVKVYQNEENIGPVRNWRKCLDYASGEYAKILWSDDLIAPEFIEKTLPFLQNNEDVGFVFTGTEIFNDDTGKKTKAYFIGESGIYDTKRFIEGSLLGSPFPVSPGNALFRKKDVKKNLLLEIPNKIGSDFKIHAIGNDVLLYLLTANKYPNFAFVNETLSYFRAHSNSISISTNKIDITLLYYLAKAYFVENYIKEKILTRKFNTKLFLILLRCKSNKLGIRSIRDFYSDRVKIEIDFVYILQLIINKIKNKLKSSLRGKDNKIGRI
jgi:glycosyltransferase involved in cell wall biosynthesis